MHENSQGDKPSEVLKILGELHSKNATVKNKPIKNSTRWIFDVAHNGKEPIDIVLTFQHNQKGEVLRSYALSPLSPAFWEACVWLEEENRKGEETLRIHANCACVFRVALDTVHSSTR